MKKKKFLKIFSATQEKYKQVLGLSSNGVYIYGAGFIGKWAAKYLETQNIPVIGFIDSDFKKIGKKILGKIISSVDSIEVNPKNPIIIGARHAVRQIEKNLSNLEAPFMSIDAFVVHQMYSTKGSEVEILLSQDERSLQTFYAVMSAMLTGSTKFLEPYIDNNPYFGQFGFYNCDSEIFVDAGAYVGDTLERFIWSVNGVFCEIHAFEPVRKHFSALCARIERLKTEWVIPEKSIYLINGALSSFNKKSILENNKTQSKLLQTEQDIFSGDLYETNCFCLDSYFETKSFTFLKVDIEGEERNLLEGGKKTIEKYKPKIALAVYHYPSDIFDIPLLLNNINSNYKFKLRHHSSRLLETIIYCMDKYNDC